MVALYRTTLGMRITKQNWRAGIVFLSADPEGADHEIALFAGVRKALELFPNKEEGRLYSKKLWRKPTDGHPSERRASHESLNRLVPGPIRRLVARFQRHLRGHAM